MQLFKVGHQYSHLANQTLNWLPNDDEERFNNNLKQNYNLLEKYNWLNKTITYQFNSFGFRCDEFSISNKNILFLGCSFTCGIGLPYEDTWAQIVSQKLRLTNCNLGIGGTSLNTAFRLGHIYIPALQPKIVILLEPEKHRLEILNHNGYYDVLPQFSGWKGIDEFYKIWISNETNCDMNRLKNVLALEHICKLNNIKFHSFQISEMNEVDKARDLGHAGVKSNANFADYVVKKLA